MFRHLLPLLWAPVEARYTTYPLLLQAVVKDVAARPGATVRVCDGHNDTATMLGYCVERGGKKHYHLIGLADLKRTAQHPFMPFVQTRDRREVLAVYFQKGLSLEEITNLIGRF